MSVVSNYRHLFLSASLLPELFYLAVPKSFEIVNFFFPSEVSDLKYSFFCDRREVHSEFKVFMPGSAFPLKPYTLLFNVVNNLSILFISVPGKGVYVRVDINAITKPPHKTCRCGQKLIKNGWRGFKYIFQIYGYSLHN